MFIHFFCLCPLSLTVKLNFNILKVVYWAGFGEKVHCIQLAEKVLRPPHKHDFSPFGVTFFQSLTIICDAMMKTFTGIFPPVHLSYEMTSVCIKLISVCINRLWMCIEIDFHLCQNDFVLKQV